MLIVSIGICIYVFVLIYREEIQEEIDRINTKKYRESFDKPPVAALINLGKVIIDSYLYTSIVLRVKGCLI